MVGGFIVALFPRPGATAAPPQPQTGALAGTRQNLMMGGNNGRGGATGFSLNDLNQFHPLDDHDGDNIIGNRRTPGARPALAPVLSEEAIETLMVGQQNLFANNYL